MRHNTTSRIESVRQRIVEQITHFGRVNIGESKETPREIRGIVIRSKNTAKLFVENHFGGQTEFIAFLVPASESRNPIG